MPESIIKALERYLTPQINEIKGELKDINTRIDSLKNEMNAKIDALDDKIDYKIDALDEKMDIMNKYIERLFNLIHPAGQK